jgi:tripartite-type tricarboxylate transporter receptor subunit TctC
VALLVAGPKGGSLDRIAAIVRTMLADVLGKPVEPRYEATTMLGENIAAAASGHAAHEVRLLLVNNTALIAGRLLGHGAQTRPLRDIEWLGVAGRYPHAVIVRDADPAKSLDEWIASARKAGRPVRLAAGVPGSMGELAGRLLGEKSSLHIVHQETADPDTPYDALRAGVIDALIDGLPNALEEVARTGARILAVTSSQRAAALPDVRAFGEWWPGEDFSDLVLLGVGGSEREDVRGAMRAAWNDVRRRARISGETAKAGAGMIELGDRAARDVIEDEFLRHAGLIARFPPRR